MSVDGASTTAQRRTRSLIDLDAELAAAIPEPERAAARQLLVGAEVRLPRGPARTLDLASVTALYIADGVLLREVTIGRASLPEVLGAGDLLQPRPVVDGLGWCAVGLHAVEPLTLIAFNERFTEGTRHWPDLRALMEQRAAERHHRAMLVGAIGHLPRVEQRVTALLWLLATEWGEVGGHGLVVPFPLTHAVIGRFVGAARSTVTLSITELTADGLLARREDGSWLLPAESEAAARELLGVEDGLAAAALRGRATRRRSVDLRRAARDAVDRALTVRDEAAALSAEARVIRRNSGA